MHDLIRVHVIWEGVLNFYLQMLVHNLSVHSWAITVTVMCTISCAYMHALMLPPRPHALSHSIVVLRTLVIWKCWYSMDQSSKRFVKFAVIFTSSVEGLVYANYTYALTAKLNNNY